MEIEMLHITLQDPCTTLFVKFSVTNPISRDMEGYTNDPQLHR
jgi:hypothetical protein